MSKSISLIIGTIAAVVAIVVISQLNRPGKTTPDDNQLSQDENTAEIKTVMTGSGEYTLDAQNSVLRWEGKKTLIAGYVDTGVINIKEGKLTMADGKIISGQFIIDMNTITGEKTGKKSGESFLTNHLKSPDFFDAEKFPTSELVISSVQPLDPKTANQYQVNGNLNIKGITNPITFTAEIYQTAAGELRALGKIELDRTLWNVRYGSGKFFQNLGDAIIDDKFTVQLSLIAKPAVAE